MDRSELEQKNKRTALIVMGVVFAMVGLAFASVPLYSLFCRVTGWGGTTQVANQLPGADEVIDRTITVRFDGNTSPDLQWGFKPERLSVDVKLGERGFINYITVSNEAKPVAGTAIFNVTPLKAGKYFNKIQCFCFDKQVLQPGQRMNMPVLFYVDPAMHDDPNLDDVSTITLSYTFFEAESEGLDNAMNAFYESEETPQKQPEEQKVEKQNM